MDNRKQKVISRPSLASISVSASRLLNEVDEITRGQSYSRIQEVRSHFESLKAGYDAKKYQWINGNDVMTLYGLLRAVWGVVLKLAWFFLLDLGRILNKITGIDEYFLVRKAFDLEGGHLGKCFEVHQKISSLREKINGIGRLRHEARVNDMPPSEGKALTFAKKFTYWVWLALFWLHKIPRVVNHVLTWSMLPVLFAAAPRFFAFLVFILLTDYLPESRFGHAVSEYAIDMFRWSMRLLRAIRLYCLGYSHQMPTSMHGALSKGITPRKIDWSKFLRVVAYVYLPMLLCEITLFYYNPVQVSLIEWAIALVPAVILYMIQTLAEEVEMRRVVVEHSQSTIWSIGTILLTSVVFGLGHMSNPEFDICEGRLYSTLSQLSGYVFDGLTWAIITYLSGGLEMSWGMHFANNIYFTTTVGYVPSPAAAFSLLTISRYQGSPLANHVQSIDTPMKLMGEVARNLWYQFERVYKIYLGEILFARQIFSISELEDEPVTSSQRIMPTKQDRLPTSKATASARSRLTQIKKFIDGINRSVQSYTGLFTQSTAAVF